MSHRTEYTRPCVHLRSYSYMVQCVLTFEISDHKMLNSCIMYPNNTTSLILGRSLLREEHDIYLHCPSEATKRLAHTYPLELKIASLGLDMTVHEVDTLEELQNMDFIIFPTLDVLPDKKRADFANKLRQIFRSILFLFSSV